jgi:deoxycytidylate deaminase
MQNLSKNDLHFLKMAQSQANRSTFEKSKRGAVIAKDNKVIAVGASAHLAIDGSHITDENAPVKTIFQGQTDQEHYHATIQAELSAIGMAVRANISLDSCTLYVTSQPNWLVWKTIFICGIKRVVFYGAYDNEKVKYYAPVNKVQVIGVGGADSAPSDDKS